jgi:hypothetical protein
MVAMPSQTIHQSRHLRKIATLHHMEANTLI